MLRVLALYNLNTMRYMGLNERAARTRAPNSEREQPSTLRTRAVHSSSSPRPQALDAVAIAASPRRRSLNRNTIERARASASRQLSALACSRE